MFEGFRVLELGTWVMVPSAATVLADFGADVIKVEHPRTGDPGRGRAAGSAKQGEVSVFVEQTNRGKRSIGLDIAVPEAREVLYKLASTCDVFMTSFLPPARQKYLIDVEHIIEDATGLQAQATMRRSLPLRFAQRIADDIVEVF